ncbi:oxygenase MpaB family protein [Streptomyces sp. NBC_00503]|uniref:oxygenase MpaB family protein n=1 Tax=Streptomyces sp. NBC_00503 TaxID=2903659 RepID=UPI002E813ED5|nr:oxygenase MpaB family protein [Streptomyces sp. NBC_00503]WUD79301.1 oxygenase MpaB family protein [Streptomyces sp. NBC_00503]
MRQTLGEWRIGLVAWRLLVLQTAHPVVAAGTARYSTYRAHPWRRIEHTMDSGSRLFFAGPEERQREIARLERAHRRIRGTDDAGRPYSAEDPEVRAWVMVTLYEAMTAMRELSGDPLSPAELDVLYAEFKEVCEALGITGDVLPATAADVPGYVERTVREVLEFGDPVRYLLFDMLREAPAPRRLGRLRPAWPLLRAVAARTLTTLTIADLPPSWHERFGTPRTRTAATLSWVVHRGMRQVMTRLPDHLRYRGQSDGEGRPEARRSTSPRLPRPRTADSRPARLEAFFRQVLDQTGDGRVDSADLQAMVHNVCWQLELPAAHEDRLYAAFETWWRQLCAGTDADADGAVECAEFVSAMLKGMDQDPEYLENGLRPAMSALFRTADTDGSGHLCADEYRILFGGSRVHPAELNDGFRELDADGDGRISEEEFVTAFTEFFTAATESTAGTALLGRP